MRPWALWLKNNNLIIVLYFLNVICMPLYFLPYLNEGWEDFKQSFKEIKNG